MYLFLFACLPLGVLLHLLRRRENTDAAILWGVAAGALVCLADYLFHFRDPAVRAAFLPNAVETVLFTSLVPQALLFLLVCLFSRDAAGYKLGCFFPLIASFYGVFIPYTVLTKPWVPGAFELLFLPLIYSVQALMTGLCLVEVTNTRARHKVLRQCLAAFCALVFLLLPINPVWTRTLAAL
jgi:hypothetical protein